MGKRNAAIAAVLVIGLAAGLTACGPKAKPGGPPAEPSGTAPYVVDGAAIINADANPGEWLSHGRTYNEQRYSPLDRINAGNVAKLGLAWSFDLPEDRGVEATPLMSEGVLYTTSSWSVVRAFDAKSGQLLWTYDPKVAKATDIKACCDAVNRGVALWRGRVYVGTLDGRLEAIDAKSGKLAWSVVTVDQNKPYTITGAPRVVKGKVLIGNGGAELGVRGYLSAYDAETGKLVWRFYTVPGLKPTDGAASDKAMDIARKTWDTDGEWKKTGGGGTVWDSMAYDPDLDLLYIGVGNGSPWNREKRSPKGGDNLFLSSIVALKPDTGEYVWHYQTTPGESWDYTATQHIILADISIGGQVRKVLMQAPKNGFFYVLDRATGRFISGQKYVAAVNWATGIDQASGRPIETPEARYKTAMHLSNPGPLGAHNWQPMAFSPRTGLVYIPTQEIPFPYMQPGKAGGADRYRPQGWNVGVDFLAAGLPDDKATLTAIKASLKGRLVAWDPVTQTEKWAVNYDGPWNGGVLATGGGLIFQGSATGELAAYDAATGKKLWAFQAQTGIVAPPMTYEIDGEQYVAVMAGFGGGFATSAGAGVNPISNGQRRLLVFKLGGKGVLPVIPATVKTWPDLPPVTATQAQIDSGMAYYSANCGVCHGASGVSNFSIPDLRYSLVTTNAAVWQGVVIGGDRAEGGMVSFKALLKPADAENIRQYLLNLAHRQKDGTADRPIVVADKPASTVKMKPAAKK
ncbi:PQQ-dependent dehydrogenase (methanol/ethanol family) [Caulobacter ginsengisoli]|uniref:PQQ-dependent dehydrogenase (Methanol/ethanol family) n=1 Tax=Caulobacter ginsengisoli TaxID=400775 RepID=A0ABU0IKY9_9CAUL|nr:PQQ-dependent dehydrogenase, methanol/ethanol family [Caulobacter ginsengisoli]MDQ0462684.1 PQQ-dependent dehydrogenase (methanol/ethanol family) [Caulobacter ginsengisoli]